MGTGQSVQELLVFDPRLYSDLDKYIYINDSYKVHRETQRLFVSMLKKGIYIKGFATDKESMVGLKMYNKKIYDIDTLDQNNSVVFYDIYLKRFDVEVPKKVHNIRMLNPDVPKDNIVIWGSGVTGRRVYKILSENGIKAEFYVDSNRALKGTYQCGLPVYAPEDMGNSAEPPIIIEAMEKWEELDACIREEYEKRFYFSFIENDVREKIYGGHFIKQMFDLMSWNGNFKFFIGKKVYVYGTGKVEREMARYLKLLDISFGGLLTDESDVAGIETCGGCNVRYVEEVLYEKDYFVWVYERKRVKRLEELGLKSHENYLYYHGVNNTSQKRRNILDTNLGHNYLTDGKYPGITIYGEDKEKDFKIGVLGGSTTDGKIFSFKAWPELMYEELHNRGLDNITVYNGGVSGYASGQELLKLIRDMIPLKPDMIIVYDGLIDLSYGNPYPLTSGYLSKVFEFAKENIENDEDDSVINGENEPICQGIEAKKDIFSAWAENIRTMYAVSSERNISFYSFCQPMLGSKNGKTEEEENMLLSVNSPELFRLMEGSFRKRISQMVKLPKYMYDLSHIFDDEKEVYMDHCHVWEKGNEIIAREIIKVILPELRCV